MVNTLVNSAVKINSFTAFHNDSVQKNPHRAGLLY